MFHLYESNSFRRGGKNGENLGSIYVKKVPTAKEAGTARTILHNTTEQSKGTGTMKLTSFHSEVAGKGSDADRAEAAPIQVTARYRICISLNKPRTLKNDGLSIYAFLKSLKSDYR